MREFRVGDRVIALGITTSKEYKGDKGIIRAIQANGDILVYWYLIAGQYMSEEQAGRMRYSPHQIALDVKKETIVICC